MNVKTVFFIFAGLVIFLVAVFFSERCKRIRSGKRSEEDWFAR